MYTAEVFIQLYRAINTSCDAKCCWNYSV